MQRERDDNYTNNVLAITVIISHLSLGFEVQGQWSKTTKATFKILIDRMSENESERGKLSTYWTKRLSVLFKDLQPYIFNDKYNSHVHIRDKTFYVYQSISPQSRP